MKRKKLLEKLNILLGMADNADKEHVDKLRKVLKTLKHKQSKLKTKLETTEGDHERRKIMRQIEVIQRQREKGVAVYKSIKEDREEGSSKKLEDVSDAL